MVVNLHKVSKSGALNQEIFMNSGQGELKEKDILYQLIEDMEIGTKNPT